MKSDSKLEDEIKSDACSHLPEYPLEFIDFIRSLSEVHLGELSAALGLTCAVWCLGAVHIYAIYKYTTNEKRRGKLYILALLFPIMAACCVGSMISPRSANILKSIGLFYILSSLYTAMSLIRYLFSSTHDMFRVLHQADNKIRMQTPPLCCCCPFLPQFEITPSRIRYLEMFTFQAPIVRIILIAINVLLLTEKGYNHKW
ncbi:hypothetical protein WR25_05654 [Diploscapter pachys]|uniref:Uncharacterized protein n=1 Tax=Diploscapter pachys TaxID=2018661 RepID=A0A2A2KR28_9BILA|nr:hypothetical protein WR25_05654 [Diploscapter pachys]